MKDPYDPNSFIKNIEYVVKRNKTMMIYSLCNEKGECDKNMHRFIRCIVKNGGITCLKKWEYRPSENSEYIHTCRVPDPGQPLIIPLQTSDIGKQSVCEKYHRFIACTGLSFQGATSAEFYDFLYSALTAYKNSMYDTPEQFFEMQNRRQLSRSFTSDGGRLLDEILFNLEGEHVSFVFDAYTLHHRHEIAGLLVTPHLDRPPLLVYLVQNTNDQSSYAEAGKFCEMLVRFYFIMILILIAFFFHYFIFFF
jgi:hypothetical protein